MKIGLFFRHTVYSADLRKIFEWFRRQRIVNIFAATYPEVIQESGENRSFSVFIYNPFGTFEIINITGSASFN